MNVPTTTTGVGEQQASAVIEQKEVHGNGPATTATGGEDYADAEEWQPKAPTSPPEPVVTESWVEDEPTDENVQRSPDEMPDVSSAEESNPPAQEEEEEEEVPPADSAAHAEETEAYEPKDHSDPPNRGSTFRGPSHQSFVDPPNKSFVDPPGSQPSSPQGYDDDTPAEYQDAAAAAAATAAAAQGETPVTSGPEDVVNSLLETFSVYSQGESAAPQPQMEETSSYEEESVEEESVEEESVEEESVEEESVEEGSDEEESESSSEESESEDVEDKDAHPEAPIIVAGTAAAAAQDPAPDSLTQAAAATAAVAGGGDNQKSGGDIEQGRRGSEKAYTGSLPREGSSHRRKPGSLEIMLIALIIIVIIVLVIALPLALIDRTPAAFETEAPKGPPDSTPSPGTEPPPTLPTILPSLPLETEPPTTSDLQYVLTGDPTTGPPGSLLGSAVSLHEDIAVAGSPGTSLGSVTGFLSINGQWTQIEQVLEGEQADSLFGTAVSVWGNGMLVGAPGVNALGTVHSTGAAYYYQFDHSSSTFSQLGATLRGTEDIEAFEEEFGASVARSGILRVVVGAPNRRQGDGGVYTFDIAQEGGEFVWKMMTSEPISQVNSREKLGSEVDMSLDGQVVIAGAPATLGGPGSFSLYMFDEVDAEWLEVMAETGKTPDEQFGSAVNIISESGDVVAVGGPGAPPGTTPLGISGLQSSASGGVVRVYRKVEDSLNYEQLGPDLVGEPGEAIGARGTVQGGMNSAGSITLIVGTANGLVKRFEYDAAADQWLQPYKTTKTGTSDAVTSVSASDGFESFIVGVSDMNTVAVYSIEASMPEIVSPPGDVDSEPLTGDVDSEPLTDTMDSLTSSPVTSVPGETPVSNDTSSTDIPSVSEEMTLPPVGPSTSAPVPGETDIPSTVLETTGVPTTSVPEETEAPSTATETTLPTVPPTAPPSAAQTTISTDPETTFPTLPPTAPPLPQTTFPVKPPTNAPGTAPPETALPSTGLPDTLLPVEPATNAPTQAISGWTSVGGPFVGSTPGVSLGESVSITPSLLAASASSETGFVKTYEFDKGEWVFLEDIQGIEAESLFGNSVDFNPNPAAQGLLIGAPRASGEGTTVITGSAHYYTRTDGGWTPLGPTIRGDSTAFAANEYFGYAVAASSKGIIAVGAPLNNDDSILRRGKVYTFSYDPASGVWKPRGGLNRNIVGSEESNLLGSSIDISADGNTLIAGAPGANAGDGAAYVYEWQGLIWVKVPDLVPVDQLSPGESLGTSVTILSDDGSIVAAGGVGYDNGKGIVRIFERQDDQSYVQLGDPIIGSDGEALGAESSISGSVTAQGAPIILVSAKTGEVKTFALNSATNTWEEAVPAVDTGSATPAISGSVSIRSFVSGLNNEVTVYSV